MRERAIELDVLHEVRSIRRLKILRVLHGERNNLVAVRFENFFQLEVITLRAAFDEKVFVD
jgi:hypothetical protein